ncbi:MAG: phosphate ABC transporter permease subunit PstC [gamma proteobacterium symbiont of Bathyaustriella thionipta]|nr:phosphate ABC transporter permease subunit PstC [gamma proteobacterium symbiont of Bathyaustriella thionipta]
MNTITILTLLLILMAFAYQVGWRRSLGIVGGRNGIRNLHSLPGYYGVYTAMLCGLPALLVLGLWVTLESSVITELVVADLPVEIRQLPAEQLGLVTNDITNLALGNITSGTVSAEMQRAAEHYRSLQQTATAALAVLVIAFAIGGLLLARRLISPHLRARNRVERIVRWLLMASSLVAIFTTLGIVLSVLFESIRFFHIISIGDFLFGLSWSPQMAIRADQVGSSGAFGVLPLFAGTLLISLIALLVAVPVGLLSAIYLSEYAGRKMRLFAKPVLEILAGIPTVVYGFFAALSVAPMIRNSGELLGLQVSSESALAAGLVMGIMIIPFVSSLSDDVINAVPQAMRDASYGIGATRSETIIRVIIPAALPGIVGGVLLAASRAIGETMIVV